MNFSRRGFFKGLVSAVLLSVAEKVLPASITKLAPPPTQFEWTMEHEGLIGSGRTFQMCFKMEGLLPAKMYTVRRSPITDKFEAVEWDNGNNSILVQRDSWSIGS